MYSNKSGKIVAYKSNFMGLEMKTLPLKIYYLFETQSNKDRERQKKRSFIYCFTTQMAAMHWARMKPRASARLPCEWQNSKNSDYALKQH